MFEAHQRAPPAVPLVFRERPDAPMDLTGNVALRLDNRITFLNPAAGSERFAHVVRETGTVGAAPGDPNASTSPLDFVRELIVYADVFEL